MARIGYARVSTVGQNLDMQIAALEKSDCDRIFVEKVSGVKERPELQAALKYMRAGDTLIVYKFDRIGRSLKDLVNIFADLQKRDIGLISLNDNIDASSNSGKFMMNVFAALAEFERTIIILLPLLNLNELLLSKDVRLAERKQSVRGSNLADLREYRKTR